MAKKTKRVRIMDGGVDSNAFDELDEFIEAMELGLQIDEYELNEAGKVQVDFFYRVSKRLALEISRRDSSKQNIKTVEAQVDAEIRRERAKNGEKVTEKEVESLKLVNPDYLDAMDEHLEHSRQVNLLSALKEAFQQRSYVLKDMVQLYIANYYSNSESNTGESRANLDRERKRREQR